MSQKALERLKGRFGDDVLETHAFRGDETAVLARSTLVAACRFLRDDAELELSMLTDITAVDLLPQKPRFEVVYQLYSIRRRHRLRLKIRVPEEDPVVDSASELWRNADWLEREIWDLYGIRFRGHPDLRRILLYEEFEGHPLRKDYVKEKRQPLVRRPEPEIAEALAQRGRARPQPTE